jgi:anti-sigma B factor antagonist
VRGAAGGPALAQTPLRWTPRHPSARVASFRFEPGCLRRVPIVKPSPVIRAGPPDPGDAWPRPSLRETAVSEITNTPYLSTVLPALSRELSATLRVSSYDRDHGTVLVLAGELDLGTRTALTDHLGQLKDRPLIYVVAEVSNLRFCDCAGLGALLRVRRWAAASGGWLRLAAPTDRLRALLRITALESALPCFPTIEAAFTDAPVMTDALPQVLRLTRPRHGSHPER